MLTCDIGPSDAKILLIGEAPGNEEEKQGIPFCGSSGKLLKSMLSHSGIDFNSCYTTNVMNCRPPDNNFGFFYQDSKRNVPSKGLEDAWFSLREKVKRIKPNIVLCLGAESLRALTGKRGITDWRGSIILFEGIKVLSTYHPTDVLRKYEHHAICELDFEKVLSNSLKPEYECEDVRVIEGTNLSLIETFSSYIDYKTVAFDIETIGDVIRCLSLAIRTSNSRIESLTIPFIKFSSSSLVNVSGASKVSMLSNNSTNATSFWNVEEEIKVLSLIQKVLTNKNIKKIGHNSISFDQPIIEKNFGIDIENHYLDTMHAFHLIYPEFPKGLDFLNTLYTNLPNYWSNVNKENDSEEWRYCAFDSAVTLLASEQIEKELRESMLDGFYFNRTHKLALAISRAQQKGVLLDKEKLNKKAKEMDFLLEQSQKEIDEIAKWNVNVDSPKQVQKLLYEQLRFPTATNENGNPTVDAEALNALKSKYPNEKILSLIIEHRSNRTIRSTFLTDNSDSDGRVRTSYNVSGEETGRISSQKNKLTGTGMDLHNVPKDVRDIFISDEGFSFTKGDLSQAEARYVAEILCRYNDFTLHNKFLDKTFDIHRWMASCIVGKPEKDVTTEDRQLGKLANHSGNYMAGPRVLIKKAPDYGLFLSYNQSKNLLERRLSAIPSLSTWWADVENKIRRTRVIYNCLGRRRIFFGRLDDTTFRDAVAQEPQSAIADVTNQIFSTLFSTLPEDCIPLLTVHDEVTVLHPDSKTSLVVKLMQEAANIPLFISGSGSIVIPIDISTGKDWKNTKPVD